MTNANIPNATISKTSNVIFTLKTMSFDHYTLKKKKNDLIINVLVIKWDAPRYDSHVKSFNFNAMKR